MVQLSTQNMKCPKPSKYLNNALKSFNKSNRSVVRDARASESFQLQTTYNFSSGRTPMKSQPKGHEKRRMGPCIDYQARQGACHVWYKWNSCLWWLLRRPGTQCRLFSYIISYTAQCSNVAAGGCNELAGNY